MSKLKGLISNVTIAILTPVLLLGATEAGFRTFYSHKLKTYFEIQSEQAMGDPIPKKEPNESRIFVWGGSAAYGFPVADRYSITAWLRKSFPHLLPELKFNVINTAWPGKSSHQILVGTRNVLKYKPDVFIIYAGNNEAPIMNRLYTDHWMFRFIHQLKYRSVFYRFLISRFDRIRKHIVYGSSGHAEKQYREETIAKKIYERPEVSLEIYENIRARYEENMMKVIKMAKKHGIRVVFLTVPTNMRTIPPGASMHHQNLSDEELKVWQEYYDLGKAAQEKGDAQIAITQYEVAAAIDPTYADLQYGLAQSYEKIGEYEAAKVAYRNAKDYDSFPWRTKTVLNDTIRKLAKENGATLVEGVELFEQLSPQNIISSGLVYDNVHPTVEAQQILTDAILKKLQEENYFAPSEQWNWEALEQARVGKSKEEWEVEGNVNAYRYILRGLHLWEQQRYLQAVEDLEEGLKHMPDFLESYAFLGHAYQTLDQSDKAIAAFKSIEEKDTSLFDFLRHKYPEINQSYRSLATTKK